MPKLKTKPKSEKNNEAPHPTLRGVVSSPPPRSEILPKQKGVHSRPKNVPRSSTKEDKIKSEKPKSVFISTVGRRKTAVARIRLYKGKGNLLVNDQPIEKYFSTDQAKLFYLKPFQVTDTLGKFHATIKVKGSGMNGQLGAVVHGLARALDKENKEAFHSLLKKAGLLTRDPRARERRKVGQMGRARKKKQSPKR